MIQIRADKPVRLKKEKQSLFISFQYKLERVQKVKSLPTRYYNPKDKTWEVPAMDLNKVLAAFDGEEIKIDTHTSSQIDEAAPVYSNGKAEQFEFKTEPFEHQIEGFNHALHHDKFLLAD